MNKINISSFNTEPLIAMNKVMKVEHVRQYELELTFSDHAVKIVDLESYLTKGVFLPLIDIDYFKKVFIQGHSIAWPNEADFCPDVLYKISDRCTI